MTAATALAAGANPAPTAARALTLLDDGTARPAPMRLVRLAEVRAVTVPGRR